MKERAMCDTCPAWYEQPDPEGAGPFGQCRASAPQRDVDGDDEGVVGRWPTTTDREWCMEHPQNKRLMADWR